MFYLIYKITNKIDGKIYIGSHKTKNIDDNYMGSGKYLNHAYKKYGLENFIKEILFVYDNANDMYAKEAELVNNDFLAEANTYNLKKGGFGGFDYINKSKKNLYGMNGRLGYGGENLKKGWNRIKSEEENKKISNTLRKKYLTGERKPAFLGKVHSEKTKKIIGEKNSINQTGRKNSQYGTCWVTHKKLGNKKIKKEEIDKYLNLGYTKGRIIKEIL
jgi:hypothetical protein